MPAWRMRVPQRGGERRGKRKKKKPKTPKQKTNNQNQQEKKKARREWGGKAAGAREEESRLDGGCYSDGKAAALAGSVPSPRILYERWRQLAAAPQTGRGAQGRRPGQPIPPPHTAPNRTPGPKRSRPGGGGGGSAAQTPSSAPLSPPAASSPGSAVGAFPARARCTPLRGGDGKIGGSRWGVRGGGGWGASGRARTECGKGSAVGPAPSGAARPRSRGSQRRRRDARGWGDGSRHRGDKYVKIP